MNNRFVKFTGATAVAVLFSYVGMVSPTWSRDSEYNADNDLIYRILIGEVAGKRGRFEVALEHYQAAADASNDPQVAERAARIALYVGDNSVVLHAARRWYALDADNIQARQSLLVALLRNGLLNEETIDHLDAVRAAASDPEQGFGAVSALLNQVNDKEVAFQAMEALKARHPQSPFAHYHYAIAALGLDDAETALANLNAALQLNPQWAQAHLLRARVLMQQGDADTALEELAAAVADQPEDKILRMGYARMLAGAERLDEARDQFQTVAEQHPEDGEPIFALGLLASDAKHYDEAVEHFKEALRLGGRTMDVYYELGRAEELRDDYRAAQDWYSQVTRGERYLNAQIRVAAMHAKQKDFAAMSAQMATLRQRHSERAVTLYTAESDILRQEKRHEESFELLTGALEQYPNDKDLLYTRALAAEKVDRLDVLEQDLRYLIEADPDNGHALNALGYTLADRTDRYQEALGYLQRAIVLLPEDAAVLDSMGWIKYRLGDYSEALGYLRRAYDRSDDAEIAAHLSEVLWVSGQQEEARDIWRQAMEKYADSHHLLKVKERLGLGQ